LIMSKHSARFYGHQVPLDDSCTKPLQSRCPQYDVDKRLRFKFGG
jgi:hypothetical protein